MSANDILSTPSSRDSASKDMTQPTGIYGFFASLQSLISRKDSASPFVKFSESTSIDPVKNELSKILKEYAGQLARSRNLKDKDKMNKAMIKLFNKPIKPIENQSPDETTYFQSVRTSADGNKKYPEAATVFENILSGEKPRPHPNGISSLAFAFISILSLSLNRSDPNQNPLNSNSTSPYFDLSPLYGSNDMETNTVRTKDGNGMLSPDCFFEDRLATLPDATFALLILWNRFHNHTAKYLLWRNEKDKNGNDKWIDPSKFRKGSQELLSQDDQIFDLARSITCINFVNIIKEDILKSFFGLPFVGPSVEVDILYDVRGSKDETRIGHCSTMEAYFLYDFTTFTSPSIVDKPLDTASVTDRDLRRQNYMGLNRNTNGYFDDGDLANVLFDAIEASISTPGARNISKQYGECVIRKIKQGQKWNVCTLNEFRVSLGLKRLQSFSEWNSNATVARAAEELYNNIDNLELYPGLLAEEATADSGFCFGRTMTWGLIADIVTRIRSDPRFTAKFNEEQLTKWGYHDCMTIGSQGPFNAVIPKLLHRTLPHNFPYKNAYSLYPFIVPTSESKARIEAFIKRAESKYDLDFSRPKTKAVKVLKTIEAISKVFNDPAKFPSPYNQNFCELTGGYGNMLGFDDLALHDRDMMLTLFALFPDEGAAKRIGAAFGEKAQKYLLDRCTLLSKTRARIDVVEDMIDATCVNWVCEAIYDRDLNPNERDKKKLGDEGARKEKEIEARKDFAACYAYIFRNGEPEIGLKVRERALDASKRLQDHLEMKLRELKRDKGDRYFGQYLMSFSGWLKEFTGQLWQEYSATGKILPQTSAQTFLDRIMKAADLKPLKHVVDRTPHLQELKAKYENGDPKRSERAGELLEKQRVVANVIALSVVISVHFAKVCAQAVDFYLDEKFAPERKRLVELCASERSTNDEIMGYIREAQRIGQPFGLWRDVSLPSTESRAIIKQGHDHPDVIIEQGDRVFADFSFAHNDPKQFKEPGKVIPGRPIKSLQGLGVHKCPAGAFIDETMAEMFRVIFSQGNLARARENGRLRTTTLHPKSASWDSEVFLDDVDGYSYCPRKLMLEFDADENIKSEKKRWKFTEDSDHVFFYLNRSLTITTIIIALIIIFIIVTITIVLINFIRYILMPTIITSVSSYPSLSYILPSYLLPSYLSLSALLLGPKQLDPECRNMTEIVPYTINSFRPKWLGLFGEPAPIIYHTPRGYRAHRVAIVAIDKRDIELRYWVDEKEHGTVPVNLDPDVDCGEDIVKCLDLGFSAALIDIPSGRHTFKAEIVQQGNETFTWGDRRRRRVKMRVDQCL